MPALSPAQSNTPTWFTEGDKNKGISWIGQDWLNILQAELLNILSEAGIKPDKGKLNQLTLSVKAIITANAYTQANNLKEIFDAGVAAQAAARGHLGLGKLATKDSLGPADVNALAKDQNLNDVPDKAKARTALQLGNSATRNVGTTAGTVAAGDDSRITGALQKDQNGADIPDKPGFIKNVGLKETLNPTKRVSIGRIGTGAFDGSTPCINIGDSDSGFIGSADGVIDIYCNNAKVGYIDNAGLHMLTDIYSGSSRLTNNGDVSGSLWGGWLSEFIKRNTPSPPDLSPYATTSWVNAYFANKSTASKSGNGWFKDASTGLMIQWGLTAGGTGTSNISLPVPFPNATLWVLGWVGGALHYGDDDWSNSAGLVDRWTIRVTTDHGWGTAWIAIGY
ncbi:hypothetical protein OB366_003697 [Salmonella enterica]|nr:hypothetical protein [Salmonella enterica]EJW3998851.1 hypothetical protein [Salmonella enterica]EKB3079127.1 hypothetical protein [Salmonella enterica]